MGPDGRPFYINHGTQVRPPPGVPPPPVPHLRAAPGRGGERRRGRGRRRRRRRRTADARGAAAARAAARAAGVRRAAQLARTCSSACATAQCSCIAAKRDCGAGCSHEKGAAATVSRKRKPCACCNFPTGREVAKAQKQATRDAGRTASRAAAAAAAAVGAAQEGGGGEGKGGSNKAFVFETVFAAPVMFCRRPPAPASLCLLRTSASESSFCARWLRAARLGLNPQRRSSATT